MVLCNFQFLGILLISIIARRGDKMPFWSALFEGIGSVVSNIFGLYGSYRQIEDASEDRHRRYESQQKVNTDISEMKTLLEESLIPDIKQTTEEFRELMNDLDFRTRVLSQQITTEIIPDAKDTTQVIRETVNELAQIGQELNDNIKENIIPHIKEKIDTSNRAIEEFVHTTQELSSIIHSNLIPDVKQTMKVARGVMDDFSRTNKLIVKDISRVLDNVKPCQEIGFIIMILIVAAILGILANKSDRNVLHRLERLVLHVSRSICISYAMIRLIYLVILKQEEPIPSLLLWLVFLPTAIFLANKLLSRFDFAFARATQSTWLIACRFGVRCLSTIKFLYFEIAIRIFVYGFSYVLHKTWFCILQCFFRCLSTFLHGAQSFWSTACRSVTGCLSVIKLTYFEILTLLRRFCVQIRRCCAAYLIYFMSVVIRCLLTFACAMQNAWLISRRSGISFLWAIKLNYFKILVLITRFASGFAHVVKQAWLIVNQRVFRSLPSINIKYAVMQTLVGNSISNFKRVVHSTWLILCPQAVGHMTVMTLKDPMMLIWVPYNEVFFLFRAICKNHNRHYPY